MKISLVPYIYIRIYSDHEVIEFKISVDRQKSASETSALDMRRADFRLQRDEGPRRTQCPELEDHDCKNDQLPTDPEIVQDLLLQLDPYKSMGPAGIHSRILKELADVIPKCLLIIFEKFWESEEVPADWQLENIVPIFKKGKKEEPGDYNPASLTSVPDKLWRRLFQEEEMQVERKRSKGPFLDKEKGHLTNADSSRIQRTEVVKAAWSKDSESGGHVN
ncbi:hypothetical protein BTVI_31743 [Pitangus sulphuratus]|nr:hypothetical protein BTVI_31743 [Pitangus sulphuratus]